MPIAARADARHNRARVLEAAQEAFAAEGLAVPLDAIARRAGVGAGTVYRHFPSKEALFEAVVSERIERLADDLTTLLTTTDGPEAFFAAFSTTVEQAVLNKALCESLAPGSIADVAMDARRQYATALTALFDRAREAGAVRPDVEMADVMALMAGCIAMVVTGASPDRSAGLVLESLRTTRSPLPPATPRPPATAPRTVTKPTRRNETPTETARCEECGAAIRASRTGRRPRFCGGACRQKAHRRRATP
jgi:AcrR family transcriptional regulator